PLSTQKTSTLGLVVAGATRMKRCAEPAWYSVTISAGSPEVWRSRREGDGDDLTTHADANDGSRRGSARHAVRQKQQSLRGARERDEHPLLGGLQLRPGSRPLPQEGGCDGEGREPVQRSDHDKSAARRRDQ